MPLKSGKSQATISKNIEIEKNAHPDMSNAQAAAIAYAKARRSGKDEETTAREIDTNGWVEIKGNPLSKVGVFPYLGSQISPELEPDRIYKVYRPEEELSSPETIESFKLLPWTDEHAMLGAEDEGLMAAEKKGIHGVIGEDVYFQDGYLRGNLKIFSNKLADLIESGKKELSIGYRCLYDIVSGVYNGEQYDAIQRSIRGNHLALVDEGRSGPDIAVLDSFTFTCDSRGLIMSEKDKNNREAKDEGEEMTLSELVKLVKELAAKVENMKGGMDKDDKEAGNKEDSEKAANEGDAKDEGDPDAFVKKANITDADMSTEQYSDAEAEKENKKMNEVSGMDSKFQQLTKEVRELKKAGTKAMLREISQRDALAQKLSEHIGTFDHADKTLDEVASYGVKKLGLRCKPGHEQAILDGYLAGAKPHTLSIAQDSKAASSSQIDAYLKGDK